MIMTLTMQFHKCQLEETVVIEAQCLIVTSCKNTKIKDSSLLLLLTLKYKTQAMTE